MDHSDHVEEFSKDNEIIELLPCLICNRSFRPTLLQRHSAICEKNSKKKKVPFDSSKQRREGTEMAAYLPPMKKTQDPYINIEKAKKNWKAKHEELIRTVKAARGEKVDSARIPSKPVDTKKCPHCARNFGPKAYDRHVEFCREKAQRISTAPVISQLAKERLEARIKYRAPPLKSQRTVTKEKYSPKVKCSTRDVSSVPMKVVQPLKNFKKRTSSSNGYSPNISRQPSIMKKKEQIPKISYKDRSAVQPSQKSAIEKKTLMKKSESARILGSQDQVKQEVIKTFNIYDSNILSKSEPHLELYNSHLEVYDPFKSAQQQMKELELDVIDIGLKNPLNSTPADSLKISPTSAFVRYSPASPVEGSADNIENVYSNQFHTETNLNSHPLHNLSNLSLCSIVSIESNDFNNKTHSAVVKGSELPNYTVKRNISHNPKKQIAIENMLYGDSEKKKSNLEFDLAEQELLKSVSEFENLLKLTADDDDIVSPFLNRTSALSMINGVHSNSSADSAYGSLNRKVEQVTADNDQGLLKTAKFCHECGFKYPVFDVKFCTECGVRRIVS